MSADSIREAGRCTGLAGDVVEKLLTQAGTKPIKDKLKEVTQEALDCGVNERKRGMREVEGGGREVEGGVEGVWLVAVDGNESMDGGKGKGVVKGEVEKGRTGGGGDTVCVVGIANDYTRDPAELMLLIRLFTVLLIA